MKRFFVANWLSFATLIALLSIAVLSRTFVARYCSDAALGSVSGTLGPYPGTSYATDGFRMIFLVVLLVVVFIIVRILTLRSSGKPALANAVASGIVLAYVVGLFGQGLPQLERDTIASNGSAAADQSDAFDASDACRNAPQALSPGGVGSFDNLLDKDDRPLPAGTRVLLDRKQRYEISGWAAESDGLHPALAVCAVVDGHVLRNASSIYGGGRPDVAASLHAPFLVSSGYAITIPAGSVAPGDHEFAIAVVSHAHGIFLVDHSVAVTVR
jgi:hypothetical protein